MILDLIAQAHKYEALADGFAKAFAFLEREDLAELPDGQIAIDGDRVFATIVHTPCGQLRMQNLKHTMPILIFNT